MNRTEIIAKAAAGRPDALEFLQVYTDRAHLIDDIVDKDREVTAEALAESEMRWMFTLSKNPFFLAHKDKLLPLMASGMNAWLDSNGMEDGPAKDVVKGTWHEVVWQVALICGGWRYMRAVSGQCRDWDFEPINVPLRNGE